MRKLNLLCAAVLVVSIGVFAAYNVREYRTRDTLGPVVGMEEEKIYVSVKDPESQLLSGMVATDAKDGDVTDLMMVESISPFVSPDTREVTYAAFDNDRHVTKAVRKMVYTDYTPVIFSLSAPFRFPVATGRRDYIANLTARDCLDGNISDKISFTSDSVFNADTPGDYKVTLEVENSAGDSWQLPVTLSIYDSSAESGAPRIALKDYLIYISPGDTIDPLDWIDHVTYKNMDYALTDAEGTFAVDTSDWGKYEKEEFRERDPEVNLGLFEVTDLVNYQTPGVYEIQYLLDDLDGNRGRVSLIVIVEEGA